MLSAALLDEEAKNLFDLLPERMQRRITIDQEKGCWLYDGHVNENGYAYLTYEGRNQRAHLVACALVGRPRPPHLTGDHTCRQRTCIFPKHIEFVTRKENILRGLIARGGRSPGRLKIACKRGHVFDEANTYHERRGSKVARKCRACDAARKRAT